MKTIIFTFSALIIHVNSKCAFSVNCSDPDNLDSCVPVTLDESQREPKLYNYTDPFICQQYLGKPTCCNNNQNKQMRSSFQQIDATFGSGGGGCDFCGANMKRFWCMYTCDPEQLSFVLVGDKNVSVVDPTDPSRMLQVMNITLTVDSETSCGLFESCQLTPYVTQVTAMGTPAGFLSFQGANAVVNGKQFMSIKYNNNFNVSLHINDFNQCNQPVPADGKDMYGFNIQEQCNCNSCASSCQTYEYTPLPPLEGLDLKLIIIIYSILMVLTGIQIIINKKKNDRNQRIIKTNDQQSPNKKSHYKEILTQENN